MVTFAPADAADTTSTPVDPNPLTGWRACPRPSARPSTARATRSRSTRHLQAPRARLPSMGSLSPARSRVRPPPNARNSTLLATRSRSTRRRRLPPDRQQPDHQASRAPRAPSARRSTCGSTTPAAARPGMPQRTRGHVQPERSRRAEPRRDLRGLEPRYGVSGALACPSKTQCTVLDVDDVGLRCHSPERQLTFDPQAATMPTPVAVPVEVAPFALVPCERSVHGRGRRRTRRTRSTPRRAAPLLPSRSTAAAPWGMWCARRSASARL